MKKAIAFAAVLMALGAGTAHAQLRPWEISIAGGPSLPTGDLADFADTGYHVQGSIGFGVPMLPVGLRADAFWQEVPDTNDGWYRQIGGLANVTLGIPLVVVEPYILGGVGLIRTETPDGVILDGDSDTSLGFNAGAGAEFPFMGLSGFVEARYLNLLGGDTAKSYQSIPITVGIRF